MIETSKAVPNLDEPCGSHNKILIVFIKINAWEYSKKTKNIWVGLKQMRRKMDLQEE